MKRYILTVLFLLSASFVSAQQNFAHNYFGNPNEIQNSLSSDNYVRILKQSKAFKEKELFDFKKLLEERNIRIKEIVYDAILYDSNFNFYTRPVKLELTYSPLGNSISEIVKVNVDNNWVTIYKTIENYDFQNKLIESIYQSWTDNKWVNKSLQSYVYADAAKSKSKLSSTWVNNEWVPSYRNTIVYNETGVKIYDLDEFLENGLWKSYYESKIIFDNDGLKKIYINNYFDNTNRSDTTTYIFDVKGNLLELIESDSQGYGRLTVRKYDQNGNLLSSIYMVKANNILENAANHLFEYDSNNNMILSISQLWYNDNWLNKTKDIYKYDTLNRKIFSLYEVWENEIWQSKIRITYSYDANGNLIEALRGFLLPEENEMKWLDNNRFIYKYDLNGKIIFEANQSLKRPFYWSSFEESYYEFDNSGNEISYSYKQAIGNNLIETKRRRSSYNRDELLIEGMSEKYENGWKPDYYQWFQNDGKYIPSGAEFSKIKIDYCVVEKINYESPQKAELFQNYPNPFNPVTKIYFTLPSDGNVIIEIYNSIGEKVLTLINESRLKGIHNIDFNGSGLASGVYFYSIQTANFFDVKKMVFIK
ncbi:MAG: hypothetical protein A2068_14785 [Ignavibacteria bacterium GWB2_35_6b]|nr:MAG: hypothetical protein A2068_14785 [Ignavibacteria bacterium GWB2_35_6b]